MLDFVIDFPIFFVFPVSLGPPCSTMEERERESINVQREERESVIITILIVYELIIILLFGNEMNEYTVVGVCARVTF